MRFTVHGSSVEETAVDDVDVGAHRGAPDGVAPNAKHPDPTTAPTLNREPLNPEPRMVKLRFTIRDTGIGIPEDKIGLLFDKFSQVDTSISRKFGGTGLGLAISRQLAELMGGEMGVRSTAGQGSAFWFTIRLSTREESRTEPLRGAANLAGLRVLVVDDNAASLEMLTTQLATWGMRPLGVADGQAALETVAEAHDRAEPFDLAVLDFQMPGMDGGELGHRLKADPRNLPLPLVILNDLGRPGDARRFESMGFAAYLNKPMRQTELYDTLALLMSNPERSSSSPIITRHMAREIQEQARLPNLSGRVLLAEDNPVNQQVALGILKKMGIRADAVANGLEAIHALKTIHYDLVLMDVMMPEMDGLAATKRIRSQESEIRSQEPESREISSDLQPSTFNLQRHRCLPVIAMTAAALKEDQDLCFEAGMDDYVSKPVNPMELARVLEKWLPVVQDGGQKAEVRGQRSEVRGQVSEVRDQRSENKEQNAEVVHTAENGWTEKARKDNGQTGTEDALPVFDRAALLERVMGDEDLLAEVMGLTLENVPVRIQELQAALEAGDVPAARMAAHTIKGMAANTSAEALREVAREMEDAAQAGKLDTVRARMGVLEEKFEALRRMVG